MRAGRWRLLAGAALLAAPVTARAATLSPLPGAARVCTDKQLSVTFGSPPLIGTSGTVVLHDLTAGTVADSIDLADPSSAQRNFGGAVSDNGTPHLFNYFPVLAAGNAAIITFHHDLAPGHRYAVTIDPGVITDADGFGGITDDTGWRFAARSDLPPSGAASLRVAADGSGDFCTVDGAIEAVPSPNTRPVAITVAPGTYNEIDWITADKPFVTVTGDDRDRTVIQYANNDTLNSEIGLGANDLCPQRRIGGTHDDYNCWRGLFGVEASDFTLRNITLHNTTPYGGSQAEAFRGNNARILLDRVTLLSFQDTLRIQTAGFVTDSLVAGDVDFTWGTGAAFLVHDELQAQHAGYYSQVRNPATNHGFVYYRDALTALPSVAAGTMFLSRIAALDYPYAEAVFVDDTLGPWVNPAGFELDSPGDTCAQAPDIHFWGTELVLGDGTPAPTAGALPCAAPVPASLLGTYTDPATVLGGWEPATIDARPASEIAGPTPGPAAPGVPLSVDWSLPPSSGGDAVIVALRLGGAVPVPVDFRVEPAAPLGTTGFRAPETAGRYEFALFRGTSLAPAAISNVLAVGG